MNSAIEFISITGKRGIKRRRDREEDESSSTEESGILNTDRFSVHVYIYQVYIYQVWTMCILGMKSWKLKETL